MGNDTSANLVTKAGGIQEFFLSIPSFYNTNGGWFLKSQSVPLRIRVYLANLADIVVTDGTSPVCTVNNVSLRVIGRDFENPGVVTAIQQNNIKAGNTHYRYLVPVHQAKNTLVSGTTSYNINLSSLIGQFSHIFVIVRTAAQVSTALGNDFSSYVALSKFSIKNASGAILPSGIETDASFNILYQNCYNFTGDGCDINSGLAGTPKNIYSMVFSEKPELAHSQGVASGSVHLTGLGESLNLTFASALSANHIVDIIGFKYILLNLGANGTLKKVEI